MPDWLHTVAILMPSDAASHAMQDAILGDCRSAEAIAVLAAYSVILGFVAVRYFRWE